ncbi:DUF2860 family protein [Guyparkeria sp. SCN-R1]|uniref:DUF2860 family protein n=1 Tax=Guyparkeria sp. SCN-R1 TaxID=2341113 RepID=UPI0013159119|nr:DUF2860 family protein [Guyparkeria sp. SCN-R1]
MNAFENLVSRAVAQAIALAILPLSLLLATGAQASPIADETGFSGEIQPLIGVMSSRSNLAVSGDQKRIDSLYSLSSRETRPIGGVLGQIDYTVVPRELSLYAGTPRSALADGELGVEVGARYLVGGVGLLTAGVIPVTVNDSEVWSDPFVVGERRDATDTDRRGLHLGLAGIAGTGLSVDYRLYRRDIDDERSGQALELSPAERRLLEREGTEHRFDLNYRLALTDRFSLTPGVQYRRLDADGAANRGWLLRPQLTARYEMDRWSLSMTGYYGVDRYDARQPIYDEYRDGKEMGVVAGVRYAEPFGWSNWSVNAYGVWSERDSDIRFYDQETGLFAVGLGYRF